MNIENRMTSLGVLLTDLVSKNIQWRWKSTFLPTLSVHSLLKIITSVQRLLKLVLSSKFVIIKCCVLLSYLSMSQLVHLPFILYIYQIYITNETGQAQTCFFLILIVFSWLNLLQIVQLPIIWLLCIGGWGKGGPIDNCII